MDEQDPCTQFVKTLQCLGSRRVKLECVPQVGCHMPIYPFPNPFVDCQLAKTDTRDEGAEHDISLLLLRSTSISVDERSMLSYVRILIYITMNVRTVSWLGARA